MFGDYCEKDQECLSGNCGERNKCIKKGDPLDSSGSESTGGNQSGSHANY